MRLKTKSRTFRLPDELFKCDKRVFIAGETENTLVVKDQHGLQFNLKKSVIRANDMGSSLGCIELSDTLYRHYVTPMIKKADEQASNLLETHFRLVMQNYHVVLKNPEYFLIRAQWLCSGASFSGPIHYCLGSVVEAWMRSKQLRSKDKEGKPVYVAKVGGSNLSGMVIGKAWSPTENCWTSLDKSCLPGGLPTWLSHYSRLQSAYRHSLVANFAAIRKLIDHCKTMAQ
jgi:hypothetical protein